MNFTQIVAEIIATTKRPDKVSVARREVNAAVSLFAQDGDWESTFSEALVPINPAEYTQAIALSLFPLHRKFKYIRRAGTTQYLKPLDMNNLAQSNCDMRDKYYRAGTNLNISMVNLASNLDIGWYAYAPILTDASPTYWLLEGAWGAVLNTAMGKVLEDIGDPTTAARYKNDGAMYWRAYRANRHNQDQ